MKLVQVIPSLGVEAAGPSYSVRRLGESLGAIGHEVSLLSVDSVCLPTRPGFRHLGFRAERPGAAICRSGDLRRALESESKKSSLIHSNGMWLLPPLYAQGVSERQGVPLVISPRGCLSEAALSHSRLRKQVFWRLFHRGAFNRCACLHATSENEYRDIRRMGLTSPVAVVPNGIDVPTGIDPRPSAAGARTLLYLGRLHPIKGLDVLLEAWARATFELGAEWRLRMVGPDEDGYRARLARMVRERGLQNVEFADAAYGDAKWAEYAGADVYVLPSRSENFGLTVAESLAAGTPVITTRGTPWSGLEATGAGWWVELAVNPLAEALVHAASLPADRLQAMGAAGRDWVLREYAWEGVARSMSAVYEWAVNGGPPPATVRTT